MDHFASWVAADGLRLLGDIIIPVAAILIPTLIAVSIARTERRTARQEREDAARDRKRERRLDAAAGVIAALAPLASFNDVDQPLQQHLWDLRARIAVYRAWIVVGDFSGDWLAAKHKEGMLRWLTVIEAIEAAGGPSNLSPTALLDLLTPGHAWAAGTMETFSGWLSGHIADDVLRREGKRLFQAQGVIPADDADGATAAA